MSELVSIIIPVYQTPIQTLHDCVKSLQQQRGDDFRVEAVIVFDGKPAFDTLSERTMGYVCGCGRCAR